MRGKKRDGEFLPHGILEQILPPLSPLTFGDIGAFLPRRALKKRIAVAVLRLTQGQPGLAGIERKADGRLIMEVGAPGSCPHRGRQF
jgi:hypothetical protein